MFGCIVLNELDPIAYWEHINDTLQEPLVSLKEGNVSEAVQAETGTSA